MTGEPWSAGEAGFVVGLERQIAQSSPVVAVQAFADTAQVAEGPLPQGSSRCGHPSDGAPGARGPWEGGGDCCHAISVGPNLA